MNQKVANDLQQLPPARSQCKNVPKERGMVISDGVLAIIGSCVFCSRCERSLLAGECYNVPYKLQKDIIGFGKVIIWF
ncbi:hypothetical protein IV203_016569 [Nitzschia inconspicua]|uniref:Uncharacterized protein n=1 Tax=Nitzschia inconspicua TaxID=303405 RepID=A0A9K3PK31_9STRA|nr:hypothetical protein IV203_016569 [Nitzschia inconspicua]